MDLTTEQLYALIGIALAQLVGAAILYWIASTTGFKRGQRAGYRDGIESATDQLEPQLHEMTNRCTSAERLLTATRNELRRVEDERDQHHRNAREALEEMSQQLADAQVLNDSNAALLRQAANNLDLAHATWHSLAAEKKAADARALAGQLRDLAVWLKPQSVQTEQQMERAA